MTYFFFDATDELFEAAGCLSCGPAPAAGEPPGACVRAGAAGRALRGRGGSGMRRSVACARAAGAARGKGLERQRPGFSRPAAAP